MARTDTLPHFLTDVADSIRAKTGSSDTIQASGFDTAIANIPSGGSSEPVIEKDVNLYDYDGTLLHSYTKNEFLALNEYPSNPTHSSLIARGWNWSFADAQSYVTSYGTLDIGQMYNTIDGKTRIYIIATKGALDPYLGIAINGTANVDWGDNTTSTITGTSTTDAIFTQHVYANEGEYVITLDSEDTIYFTGDANGCYILADPSDLQYKAIKYRSLIDSIEFGDNVILGSRACTKLQCIKSIMVPYGVTTINEYLLQMCYSLNYIVLPNTITEVKTYSLVNYSLKRAMLPNSITTIGSVTLSYSYTMDKFCVPTSMTSLPNSFFTSCSSIKEVIIPNSILTIGASAFNGCSSLRKVTLPNNLTGIGNSAFLACYSLDTIVFPSTISSIGSSVFSNDKGIKLVDFRNATQVPTLANASSFNTIDTNAKIVVPDALYEEWIVANKWSDVTISIVKASDYDD